MVVHDETPTPLTFAELYRRDSGFRRDVRDHENKLLDQDPAYEAWLEERAQESLEDLYNSQEYV